MSWTAPFAALSVYGEITRRARRPYDRETFLAWQDRRIQDWLIRGPAKCAAFADLIDPKTQLADLPKMDKAQLMADFPAYNTHGISAEQGWEAFSGSRRVGRCHVGASTGTSGNRGLFVISDRERYMWLGAMLAKALPGFWHQRTRVAVILPLNTALYDAANGFGPIQLRFFDLTLGPEAWHDKLAAFSPTILIAPPKILRWCAEHMNGRIAPARIIAGAETLDPVDLPIISSSFGKPEQIYMATEGLIASTCRAGRLHLNEDLMHVELEGAGNDLVSPVISDFRRTTQAMVRYRMNDLLRMGEGMCPCGSPHRVVDAVIGRQDDCFNLPGSTGSEILVTPDILRNAVLDADRSVTDFRIRQTGPSQVSLALDGGLGPISAEKVRQSLLSVCLSRGCSSDLEICLEDMPVGLETSRKLRRVEKSWKG